MNTIYTWNPVFQYIYLDILFFSLTLAILVKVIGFEPIKNIIREVLNERT